MDEKIMYGEAMMKEAREISAFLKEYIIISR
jgi:hypothetical protein